MYWHNGCINARYAGKGAGLLTAPPKSGLPTRMALMQDHVAYIAYTTLLAQTLSPISSLMRLRNKRQAPSSLCLGGNSPTAWLESPAGVKIHLGCKTIF